MKRLLLVKIALLAVPFLLWLGWPLFVLLVTRETITIDRVIQLQAGRVPFVYGPGLVNPAAPFKLRSTIARDPELLALGTSRVMQFRGAFFRAPALFYNAGGGIENVFHYRQFLKSLPPTARVRIILLGIDQWEFNAKYARNPGNPYHYEPASLPFLLQTNWKKIYTDYREGKYTVRKIGAGDGTAWRLGYRAMVNGSGFRNDGSHCYGERRFLGHRAPGVMDPYFVTTLHKIDTGFDRFAYAQDLDQAPLDELALFFAECRDRDIHVVAFLPPFAHTVWSAMQGRAEQYRYLPQVFPAVQQVCRQHDVPVFDFSDLACLGGTDDEAIDGFHGSEKSYLRLLIRLAEQDPQLGAECDLPALQEMLAHAVAPCAVLGD